MAKQQGTDFENFKANNRGERQSITDKITPLKFADKKWTKLRIYGGLFGYTTYWCKVDAKDMSPKPKRFPVISPSYDPKTQSFDSTIYDPWYETHKTQPYDKEDKQARIKQLVQVDTRFYVNAISRAAQKNAPSRMPKPTAAERKSGFKDKDSDTFTPWVPVPIGKSLAQKIKELMGLNVVESKKTGNAQAYSVTHEKYGCDILVYYDKDKAPADMYQVQLGERKALTEEELAYLQWDLSELVTPAAEEEVRRDYEGWAKRMGIKTTKKRKHEIEELDEDVDLDEEEDEDEDDAPKSKKKKVAAKKAPAKGKKKVVEEDDDEDEDEDFDDEDEDEDEDDAPKSKKKSVAKKGKKVADEDDEDEEDEDEDLDDEDEDEDDEDDEDDEPVSKKKKPAAKKAPPKKGKKVVDEDDEDEDEDEDDDFDDEDEDEDEDDEPVSKKKKPAAKKAPAKGKKKVVDEDEDEDDEDDDFDDEEDEDEDDEPVAKKGKKAPAKKGKKVADEDEDEDEEDEDDDFDDEDDEDDEPPAKKKVAAKKAVKKRR